MKTILLAMMLTCLTNGIYAGFSSEEIKQTASKIWNILTSRGNSPKESQHQQDIINNAIEKEELEQEEKKSLAEIFEERKKIFAEQEKEKKEKTLHDQKTKPTLVIFGTQEDSNIVEKSLSDIEVPLRTLSPLIENLSQILSSNISALQIDDDIGNEMRKSILIIDIMERMHKYIKLSIKGINEIHSGVAVLASTNNTTDDSYAVGNNQIDRGLAILDCEKFISDSINNEISEFIKIVTPRHQKVFNSIFRTHMNEIAEAASSITQIVDLYEQNICPKIKREDLSTSFNEKQQSIRNIVASVSMFVEFVKSLDKYYASDNKEFIFSLNKTKK